MIEYKRKNKTFIMPVPTNTARHAYIGTCKRHTICPVRLPTGTHCHQLSNEMAAAMAAHDNHLIYNGLQNVTYPLPKQAVSHSKTGRIAAPNGRFCATTGNIRKTEPTAAVLSWRLNARALCLYPNKHATMPRPG